MDEIMKILKGSFNVAKVVNGGGLGNCFAGNWEMGNGNWSGCFSSLEMKLGNGEW